MQKCVCVCYTIICCSGLLIDGSSSRFPHNVDRCAQARRGVRLALLRQAAAAQSSAAGGVVTRSV